MSAGRAPLVVVDIVGLTPSMLGPHTPHLNRLVDGGFQASLTGAFPAVTCSVQSSILTGTSPSSHGIVANGWYFRDLAEIGFWKQSNHLVQGEKVWHQARRSIPDFTVSQLFWWYNMYADVDHSVTLRPIYPADGRKIPALYSYPATLHRRYEQSLGDFPMFNFWGPKSDIKCSEWIASCAIQEFDEHRPSLQLVYLPHLDYNLQRLGPGDPRIQEDVSQIDQVAGRLIEHVRAAGADVVVLSEYGIEAVHGHVDINVALRTEGLLQVRETLGWELLDPGASQAFAVADHQVAHVYVNAPGELSRVRRLLESLPGVERVLDDNGKAEMGLDHPRSGELVAIAAPGHWFTYYYWLDPAKAPDFARTVDIHRKPGFDPVELFVDPAIRFPVAKVAWRLLQKRLGMRMLMDVIPLDASLVRGSHGRLAADAANGPLLIGSRKDLAVDALAVTDVKALMLRHWQSEA
jgi:predicted AlkP superfamily pyrophosphatase or phosphodiesterase